MNKISSWISTHHSGICCVLAGIMICTGVNAALAQDWTLAAISMLLAITNLFLYRP